MANISPHFAIFLKDLSFNMKRQDIADIKFLCNIPAGEAENIETGYDIFKWLISEEKLHENCLQSLVEILNHIYRKDLSKKVLEYGSKLKDVEEKPYCSQKVQDRGPSFAEHYPIQVSSPSPVATTFEQGSKKKLLGPSYFSKVKQVTSSKASESPYSTPGKTIGEPQESQDQNGVTSPIEKFSAEAECEQETEQSTVQETMPPVILGLSSTPSYLQPSLAYDAGLRDAYDSSYPMTKKPCGLCVIISNEDFSKAREKETMQHVEDRDGSEIDVDNLIKTFEWLNFEVEEHVYRDKEGHQMWRILSEYGRYDHSNYDCFACVILSHGNYAGILGVDGKALAARRILSLFDGLACSTLAGKPKLFFIQACRGDAKDLGARVDSVEDHFSVTSIPNEGDFFVGYATPPGYVSWRHLTKGSWYISKLCEVLLDRAHKHHLLDMMVDVNKEVSKAYTDRGYQQIPCPLFTLRGKVFLYPKSVAQRPASLVLKSSTDAMDNLKLESSDEDSCSNLPVS